MSKRAETELDKLLLRPYVDFFFVFRFIVYKGIYSLFFYDDKRLLVRALVILEIIFAHYAFLDENKPCRNAIFEIALDRAAGFVLGLKHLVFLRHIERFLEPARFHSFRALYVVYDPVGFFAGNIRFLPRKFRKNRRLAAFVIARRRLFSVRASR